MPLKARTEEPLKLLHEIMKKVDEGTIRTWAYNRHGHFTHTPEQWYGRAWIKHRLTDGAIVFRVVLKNKDDYASVIGVFQGRFCEMLQNHFNYSATFTSEGNTSTSPRTKRKRRTTESQGSAKRKPK